MGRRASEPSSAGATGGPGGGARRRPRTVREAWQDNPGWRRLYLARTSSLLGNWLNTLAIVHLIGAEQQAGALAYAAVFLLKQLPSVVLGPAAGVLADRVPRRTIMIVCDVVCVGLALGFLLLTPGQDAGWVYTLAALQIASATFFEPARQAAVPDLVAPRDLVATNTLASLTWSLTFALGTIAGGAVLAFVGWEVAMLLDALSYAVSGLLIARIRLPPLAAPSRAAAVGPVAASWRDLRGALDYLRGAPLVAHMLAAKGVWACFGAASLFLTLLGLDPRFWVDGNRDLGIATLWTARAVGTGVGPFVARAFTGEDLGRLRAAVAGGFVFTLLGYAGVPLCGGPETAVPLIVVAHIGGAIVWVMSTVVLQLTVAEEVRGRLFAAELAGVMLMGSLLSVVWAAVIDFSDWTLGNAIWGGVAVLCLGWLAWLVWGLRVGGLGTWGRAPGVVERAPASTDPAIED